MCYKHNTVKMEVKKMRSFEDKKNGKYLASQLLGFLTSSSPGFTLLEIMIALAIIGMTLITVLYTVNYHSGVSNDNALTTQMILSAKEKISLLEINPANSKGNVEGTGWTFENIVRETDDPSIIELKTVVKGQGKEVALNEFVYKK